MGAQHVSEVASLYQGLDVVLVVTNLLLSIPVAVAAVAFTDVALRFVWTSVVLYLIVSLQGSIQAIMTFNRFIHFSDWVIGHSHLAMIGFASFAAMGGLAHIWPRVPGVRFNARAMAWSYWLLLLGLGLMVADLTGAGLVQASLWNGHLPWMESVRSSQPYWLMRSVSGCVLITGFLTFAASFFTGPRCLVEVPKSAPGDTIETPSGQRARYWLNTAYAATFGAGLLFYIISFLALGVVPAVRLRAQIARTTPPHAFVPLTPAELRGQQIYAQNGCAYCHTQQVRFTAPDQRRFGHPTQAWETQHEYPQMWGTRRVGPDLARESGKRPDDWQLVHLFNPRYVVPDSVMPAYAWLFAGSAESPTPGATDLVAYLNTLGRAGAVPPQSIAPAEQIMPASANLDAGKQVFARDCSGCHGADGAGHSPGGRALRPVAFNLAGNQLDPQVVARALRQGVAGTAMPAWNELPADEFQAVLNFSARLGQAPELAAGEAWAPPDVLREAGHRVYTTHCAVCHGESGAGNGPDAGKHTPRPANFEQLKPSYRAAAEVIHAGVAGSGMAAWPLLTDPEIQAVTYYIRSFYRVPPTTANAQTDAAMESMP
jgi:mono/diheme cytochrome c family protein